MVKNEKNVRNEEIEIYHQLHTYISTKSSTRGKQNHQQWEISTLTRGKYQH